MRSAGLERFFRKVETFLQQHIPSDEQRCDWPAFIRSEYSYATRAGHRTEREIIHYILDKLEQTN